MLAGVFNDEDLLELDDMLAEGVRQGQLAHAAIRFGQSKRATLHNVPVGVDQGHHGDRHIKHASPGLGELVQSSIGRRVK
jgi:hypothetical protein